MHFHDLIPTTIFTYLKLIVRIIVFFFCLNLFFMICNYFNISYIAKQVQDSVRIHNYLPEHDYLAFNNLCKDLVKGEIKTDDEVYDANKQGIPGVNKIVTNLRIVVWDESGNGLRDIDMSKSIMDASVDTDYDTAGVDDYFIGARGRKNKRQNGEILYAGVVFKYHFIVPLFVWNFSVPVYNGGSNLSEMFKTEGGPSFDQQAPRGRQAILDNQEIYKVEFNPEEDNIKNLFGVMPVICEEWYPDVLTDTNYNRS